DLAEAAAGAVLSVVTLSDNVGEPIAVDVTGGDPKRPGIGAEVKVHFRAEAQGRGAGDGVVLQDRDRVTDRVGVGGDDIEVAVAVEVRQRNTERNLASGFKMRPRQTDGGTAYRGLVEKHRYLVAAGTVEGHDDVQPSVMVQVPERHPPRKRAG